MLVVYTLIKIGITSFSSTSKLAPTRSFGRGFVIGSPIIIKVIESPFSRLRIIIPRRVAQGTKMIIISENPLSLTPLPTLIIPTRAKCSTTSIIFAKFLKFMIREIHRTNL